MTKKKMLKLLDIAIVIKEYKNNGCSYVNNCRLKELLKTIIEKLND